MLAEPCPHLSLQPWTQVLNCCDVRYHAVTYDPMTKIRKSLLLDTPGCRASLEVHKMSDRCRFCMS